MVLSLHASLFGLVWNVKLVPSLLVLLREEDFFEIKVRYVRGEWVYISFELEMVCSKFKKYLGFHAFFLILDRLLMGLE